GPRQEGDPGEDPEKGKTGQAPRDPKREERQGRKVEEVQEEERRFGDGQELQGEADRQSLQGPRDLGVKILIHQVLVGTVSGPLAGGGELEADQVGLQGILVRLTRPREREGKPEKDPEDEKRNE